MELKYCINRNDKNKYENIHSLLKNELHISNRLLSKLIEEKNISLNHSICDTRSFFEVNDILIINFNYPEDNANVVPTKMEPAGVASHPSLLHYAESLSNGVKFYFDSIGLQKKIRPVNRLDFNTSRISYFRKMWLYTRNT